MNETALINAAIVGGTGYTGVELIRLLSSHPKVNLTLLTSRSEAGKRADSVFPSLRGVTDIAYSDVDEATTQQLLQCDVVFFATPHGVAMQQAQALVDAGVKIVDLAADFRLQSLDAFETWYKQSHSCPDLLKSAVYGLPEVTREHIKDAKIVGNPGCYPTTAILGLKPIIDYQNKTSQKIVESRIIVDAKSGVSGAGRQAKLDLNYAETTDNFKAYGLNGHRHLPEIEQGIHLIMESKFEYKIRFIPHLVPMIRGMFTTIHLELSDLDLSDIDSPDKQVNLQQIYERAYADEPFVDVLPSGMMPDTRSVRASNMLRIAVHQDNSRSEATILVVQDNLMKGAAGQAVQSMNIMFNFDESFGLSHTAIVP